MKKKSAWESGKLQNSTEGHPLLLAEDLDLSSDDKKCPKELAKEKRKKAYQEAKRRKKEYLEMRKQNMSEEEKAKIAEQKERQKQRRKAAYQAAKKKAKELQNKDKRPKKKDIKPEDFPGLSIVPASSLEPKSKPSSTTRSRARLSLVPDP